MPNNHKIPKWVLFDQIHIDVNIRSDMSAKRRKDLKDLLNSEPMNSLFKSVIQGPYRDTIQVKISR